MSEANQGNNPDTSAIVPVKRKRGRPRKYPRPDLDQAGNAHVSRDHNQSRGENARVPIGSEGANGNQPHQVDPVSVSDVNDAMMGQVVNGIIEAEFDAGYLLTVRVGDSETTLRGVVFKPGRYVPVAADNDIAPGVQMIRRNEIPIPRDNHGHNPQSRERNGTAHGARAAYPVASKGKQVPSVGTQTATPGFLRGNVVPGVLNPVNLSNGIVPAGEMSSVATQAAHLSASKGKQVLDATNPSNGSTATNQEPAAENQVAHIQSQNNNQVMPSGLQNETFPFSPKPSWTLQEAEAKSMKLPGMPFEKLLTEVIKRIQVPAQTGAIGSPGGNLSEKDSGRTVEDDVSDTDQALSVEPLQAVQPALPDHPEVISRPLENYKTGKMTELLQEKMTENKATWAGEQAADSRPQLDQQKSSETELQDEDNGHSEKSVRATSV